ncbi:hypothetical protein J5N97_012240 [Dioscorea zingiberensis]|uniref:Uncharacterized protein n=1 Tax=Dioscorea zingiberensis TaxID=325984 RepID=A0A9D5CNS4_9LILI|nr:hypothetical protein J5N97_012240 [Dioscorea zingiberensis]
MGGGDPSWSESCRACGVHGCPSSPLIDQPAQADQLGTASSEPTGAARALDETIFPLTRPANSCDFHHLEQPPSVPVLVEIAANEIPATTLTPAPSLIAASHHQEQAIPARQYYMGENSAPPPPPPPPPSQSPDNEVPIQRPVDERSDYPPPGHRPFGGEDLRRRSMRRPFPGSSHQGRGYEYVSLISDLGRQRCRQYYPNDHYLNNRPWYRRVDIWNGRNSSNCELIPGGRTRRGRERVPASNCFPDGGEGSNYVPPPPLRRWNTCPVREPPSYNYNSNIPRENENDHQDQPAGRQPDAGDQGTVVQDNIVIGDPSRIRIGEGNRGGRSTRGRVTGNVVVR